MEKKEKPQSFKRKAAKKMSKQCGECACFGGRRKVKLKKHNWVKTAAPRRF